MSGHWYRAYGLQIHSDVPFPAPTSEPGVADLRIAYGPVKPDEPIIPDAISLLNATPEKVIARWEGAGMLLIRGGHEIIVDPAPNADHDLLSQWVQSAAISIILHQRGFLVLHASGVAVNGHAVAFCGEVGQGKSTTAAALHARGHRLLADDVVAVKIRPGESPLVIPGFPHMKLLPQSLGFLGENPEGLALVAGDDEKRIRPLSERFSLEPVPLKCVFVLGEAPAPSIDPLPLQTALMELTKNLFVGRRVDFLRRTDTAASHLANITGLINSAAICGLNRPKSFDLLPKVIDMIEAKVNAPSRPK